MKVFQFSDDSFGYLFPFYLLLGEKEEILKYGPAWTKLDHWDATMVFQEKFEFIRPGRITQLSELDLNSNAPVIFKRRRDGQLFRGKFQDYEGNYLYLGTPWFADVEELTHIGLTMNDFAPHDATIELLHSLKQRDINNTELAAILKQSNDQKNRLKKEESERLYHEAMLQTLADCAEELLTNSNLEVAMRKTVKEVGEGLHAQTAHYFYCDDEATHHVLRPLDPALNLNDLRLAKADFQVWTSQEEIVYTANLEKGAFKDFLDKAGLSQFSLFEVKQGKHCAGTLLFGFEDANRNWTESERSLIRSFANNLGSALSNEASKLALEQMAQFPMQSPDPVLRIGKSGEVILKNPAAESIAYMLIEGKVWDEQGFYNLIKDRVKEAHPSLKLEGRHEGITYQITAIPNKDNSYINIYLNDISDRKYAEMKLQKQEEKYRNIIANMHLGLIEVDLEDRVIYANQSFYDMCGYTPEELVGKSAAKILTDSVNQDIIEKKNSLRTRGVADMYEVRIKKKNGEFADWLISGAPSFNDKGQPIGSIGIHLDITSQKVMEQDLHEAINKAEESARYKESFLANMSHEIRTPLNAIIGMIREMMRDYHSEKQGIYLQNADRASKHLLSIVNDVLDLSKIEAGQLELEKRNFSLKQLFEDCRQIVSPLLREKLLDFKIQLDPKLHLWYVGDEIRIRQVLLNLLNNAVKFTAEGSIHISCELIQQNNASDTVNLCIKDTGIGMDKAFTENLFQKFVQADVSVGRKYGGTGLGMAITRELLQLMNGQITVQSVLNEGSEFCISLELPHGIAEMDTKHDSQSIHSISRGKRILLVEDNELNRLVAINSLEVLGIQATEAENGQEALEKLKQDPRFDLILMDLQMPIMDGFEASRKIRNELKLDMPILALTANAFKSVLEKCKEVGMQDFITKPFEEKNFFEKLRSYLDPNQADTQNQVIPDIAAMPTKLFSLKKLEELSRGNDEFIDKMLEMFLELTPQNLHEIEDALEHENRLKLAQNIHKIRPSLHNLCIDAVEQDLLWIEGNAPHADWTLLSQKTTFCLEHILKTLAEIQQYRESRIQN